MRELFGGSALLFRRLHEERQEPQWIAGSIEGQRVVVPDSLERLFGRLEQDRHDRRLVRLLYVGGIDGIGEHHVEVLLREDARAFGRGATPCHLMTNHLKGRREVVARNCCDRRRSIVAEDQDFERARGSVHTGEVGSPTGDQELIASRITNPGNQENDANGERCENTAHGFAPLGNGTKIPRAGPICKGSLRLGGPSVFRQQLFMAPVDRGDEGSILWSAREPWETFDDGESQDA